MIFIDTSFLVALLASADARHDAAVAILKRVDGRRFMTTTQVAGELWTVARSRWGHRRAVEYLDAFRQTPRCEFIRHQTADEDEAFEWLRRRDERAYSFVDATSFAVMRRLHITEALAFDQDFTSAGFLEIRV